VTLPLVSLGMPYARELLKHRRATAALCGASLAVQILAISVDHQRFYMQRSFAPFFWVDETQMYRHSALFARPGELLAIVQRRDVDQTTALVPGPLPFSMTSTIWGPPSLKGAPQWMRQYLVFFVPRPWPLWSLYLSPKYRPGPTNQFALLGLATAVVALRLAFRRANQHDRSYAAENKQVVQA
jgi:hypothetical protein